MYVTTPPTTFSPKRFARNVFIALIAGAVLAPIADRIQGAGPDVLGNAKQAATTVIGNFHMAQAQQGELFRGVQLP